MRPQDFRGLAQPLRLHVGQGDGAATIELTVESVAELPPHSLRAEPFSLILRGPRVPLLPQATYALTHPLLGGVEVFLVPVGQDGQGARYEATFN